VIAATITASAGDHPTDAQTLARFTIRSSTGFSEPAMMCSMRPPFNGAKPPAELSYG
jgi:hypothetical protein